MVVDLLGRAHLGDETLLHDDDLVGEGHGLALVMGHVHGGDARPLLDAADLGAHGDAELGVQVAEGLVEQQHAGLHDQGAGQRHALLLAAGELVGHAALHALEAHQSEDVRDPALDLVLGDLADLEAVGHVVEDVIVREQRVALEHHGRVPLVGGQLVDGLVAEIDLALVGALKARDHSQRGGLAAARGAQQRHEGPGLDLQVGVLHGVEVLLGLGILIDLGNMFQAYAFFLFSHSLSPPLSIFCWYRRIS